MKRIDGGNQHNYMIRTPSVFYSNYVATRFIYQHYQYFVFCGALKYKKWSAHRKSLEPLSYSTILEREKTYFELKGFGSFNRNFLERTNDEALSNEQTLDFKNLVIA
jgi:hypothetical protein